MNNTPASLAWNETKSKIKSRFGKLTDSSIEAARENLDLLAEKIQSAYGYAKAHAEREVTKLRVSLIAVVPEPVPIPVTVPSGEQK